MTQDTEARSRRASQTAPVVEDLSEAINQAVGRQADDQVRSVRVFADCYRCNWWVREKTGPAWLPATGKIRMSRFLRATKVGGRLVIEDAGNRQ